VIRTLVTGASGGLGKAVLHWLAVQKKYDVQALYRSLPNYQAGRHQCDLSQPGQLKALLERVQPQLVLHLAADFSEDFTRAQAVNFSAAVELLEWAQANAGSKPRVLLIGSAAEYGCVAPSDNPIKESHALAPVSVYGMSKACQSQLLRLYALRGVDVVCARLFNLRGAGLSERMFVGRLAQQIAELHAGSRQTIELGPTSAARDFIEIEAAVQQLMTIARRGQSGEIYHVGSGQPLTMRALLEQELARYGLDVRVVREAAAFSNRSGYDVPIIYANMEKTLALMSATHG
jgi:nucleoside-diphosphate-sugar epimerase